MHSLIVVNLYLIVFRKKIKVLGIFLKPGMVTYWISGFCFVTIYHVSIHELKGIKTAQTLGSLSFISFCVFCLYFNNFRGYVRKKIPLYQGKGTIFRNIQKTGRWHILPWETDVVPMS